MKKLVFITTLCMFSSMLIHAQDNRPSNPQPDSIIKLIPIADGRHVSYVYTIGGKMQTPDDIKNRLLSYEPSAAEISVAKKNLTWAFISLGGMSASMIGATIEYATNNKHAGETTAIVNGTAGFVYQQHSLTGAYVLTGLAVGFLTSTIITFVSARKHSDKALKLYNHQFE